MRYGRPGFSGSGLISWRLASNAQAWQRPLSFPFSTSRRAIPYRSPDRKSSQILSVAHFQTVSLSPFISCRLPLPSLYQTIKTPFSFLCTQNRLCFLKWPRLLLTRNVLNCSPCVRIAAPRPRPYGAETSWAPSSATLVASF